jgi:hypothetical protein
MVHALGEVRRVLTPDGRMADLRPVSCCPKLEIFVAGTPEVAGEIDDRPRIPDDVASDAAIERVQADGLYEQEATISFLYPYYFRTLEQMVDHFEERWSRQASLSADVVRKAQQLVAREAFDGQVRVSWKMVLGVYVVR